MPTYALLPPVALAALFAGLIASRAVVAVPAGEPLTAVPWRQHLTTIGLRQVLTIAAPVLAGVTLATVTLPPVYWPTAAWLVFLAVTLSAIDLRHHRLPDRLTLPALPLSMLALLVPTLTDGTWAAWGRAWAGALLLGAVYWVGWFFGAMGYGDVKLAPTLGAITAWAGWSVFLTGAVLTCLVAAVLGAILAAPKVRSVPRGERWMAFRKARIPFGPAMFAGALIAVVWGEQLVGWYLAGLA